MGTVRNQAVIARDRYDAVLFDLDGVVTDTAGIHASSWKRMFDAYLRDRAQRTGEAFRPFEVATDYKLHVDGKPRYDGVRDFLRARGIDLPEGAPQDDPDAETICGLGNRKNDMVNAAIAAGEVVTYPASVALIRKLRADGIKCAVVTSSQNRTAVLEAAGIADLFEAAVDGNTIVALGLAGKPAPDAFLEAAKALGVSPARAVVVEDAISGVQAGANGNFGLVIGVARHDNADELRQNGAQVVVNDLSEFLEAD
ncbi:MAG: beta-phosphoglucomutase family hydrolase [Gammaproteobacteria bacterium]|nr:beta-phosphoglucomutase family hydrolase [Gammaproteobacteria bacterium]